MLKSEDRTDPRVEILYKNLRSKNYELQKLDTLSYDYFMGLAKEAIKTLDEYYGDARYWMAAEFERDRVLNELQATIDRIRNAGLSP